jgi:hypothetical protein
MAGTDPRLLASLALGLLLGACEQPGAFRRLDAREVSTPRFHTGMPWAIHVELGPSSVRLVDGLAIEARVSALDEDGEPLPVLSLESEKTDVFVVTPGPERGRFVFVGAAPGDSTLLLFSDGRAVGTLPVRVVAQPDRSTE